MALTKKQQEALDLMRSGANVFLSGEAGTGKSYVLREFLERTNRKVVVCAPTGIAAINVAGSTLHRTFAIPQEPILPGREAKSREIIEKCDTIVIDEISMCRFDAFEFVAKSIRESEERTGAKQLIVIGDFLQLPPVITDKDRKILVEGWGKDTVGDGFAFKAPAWDTFGFRMVVLDEVVRQRGNLDFVTKLNAVRRGNEAALAWFNQNHAQEKQKGICVCPLNREIDEINRAEINKLKTRKKTYTADVYGTVGPNDKPTADALMIKPEMRVMTLINDTDGRFQNGSLGTVIKTNHDSVNVVFDDGCTAEIQPYKWSVYDYEIKNGEVKKTEIGSFTQIPLKPAYAVTIHKSQGQTYDSVNIKPSCFAPGQLYVALSRCKEIEKLHLLSPVKPKDLKTSLDVLKFYGYDSEEHPIFEIDTKSKIEATEQSVPLDLDTETNSSHGGKRAGAGRKGKYGNVPTKTIRVPVDAIPAIERLLAEWRSKHE